MDTNSLFNYAVKDVGGPRDLSHFLGTTTFGLDNQQMGEKKQVEERSSLFNYLMKDVGGPRDISYFLQGL